MRRTLNNVPKGYDSWLEWDLAQVLKSCDYHSCTVNYIQEKKYHPDFVFDDNGKTIYIEAKGRFREQSEARKYIDVRACLPDNCELVFVFQRPENVMPGAQRRKDGTKRTHKEWADYHGFRWYTPKTLPEEWMCDT